MFNEAAGRGHTDIMEFLIRFSPSAWEYFQTPYVVETLYFFAAKNNQKEMIAWIYNALASRSSKRTVHSDETPDSHRRSDDREEPKGDRRSCARRSSTAGERVVRRRMARQYHASYLFLWWRVDEQYGGARLGVKYGLHTSSIMQPQLSQPTQSRDDTMDCRQRSRDQIHNAGKLFLSYEIS